jgi:hypothetical protein
MMTRILLLYLCLLTLTQCSRCKNDPTPTDQVQPATQTGANTFGCFVNGQPCTHSANNGTANYVMLYGPGFHRGICRYLLLRTY